MVLSTCVSTEVKVLSWPVSFKSLAVKLLALMGLLNLSDRKHFAQTYLLPALDTELVEMTIPDKPQSSKQKYRLTPAGKMLMISLQKDEP